MLLSVFRKLRLNKKKLKVKSAEGMEESTSALIHSSPAKAQRSGRKSKTHLKHDHKCHKAKNKSKEFLLDKIDQLRYKNYLLNKKVNLSALSMDSGLSQTKMLSPFEVNVNLAYQHVNAENNRLKNEMEKLLQETEEIRSTGSKLKLENENLRNDVSLLKNLVYKLNVELEKYQYGVRKVEEGERKADRLPKNYEKEFLKPILPLLKAYSEALQEKDDIIKDLESEYKKFNLAFNDLLQENEKLYEELEKKFLRSDGALLNEVEVLKKDLEVTKQENNLLLQQIRLEKDKLMKVHSVFKIRVEEVSREKEDINNNMEECKADLYVLKGKYSVLKQEFERLKMDNSNKVPLAVHSASINECRKLFEDLKNEYDIEKQRLTQKIKEQQGLLTKQNKQEEEWAEEKNFLEKSNFNQTFQIESLKRKISELENQLGGGGKLVMDVVEKREFVETKNQLRDANKLNEDLNVKLSNTKKQLKKAMLFAEDIVRQQENLLLQLHEKQKENNYMSSQFGHLKTQLKDVEKGAKEDLNSIEDKIKSLESENYALAINNRKLEKLLAEKEEILNKLEPTKDFPS